MRVSVRFLPFVLAASTAWGQAAVTDVAVNNFSSTVVEFQWTTPQVHPTIPGNTIVQYEIRYSLAGPVTEATWEAASGVGFFTPGASTLPGDLERIRVEDGDESRFGQSDLYHFAMRYQDMVSGWSPVSNSVAVTWDVTAPARIDDLAVIAATSFSLTFAWTAPGDDQDVGLAEAYEVRMKTSPPDGDVSAWWDGADPVGVVPVPAAGGQTLTIDGLPADRTCYVAIRAADEKPNWGPISPVVAGTTSPGASEEAGSGDSSGGCGGTAPAASWPVALFLLLAASLFKPGGVA